MLRVVLQIPELFDVFVRRKQVIAGVDGEHEDFDVPGLHGGLGHLRVVAGETDVFDAALRLQRFCVVQNAVVQDGLPVGEGIAVVDHADVQIVDGQILQLVFERGLHLFEVAGPLVFTIQPRRAQVALDDELVPSPLQRLPNGFVQVRVRRVQVEVVDAGLLCKVEELPGHAAVFFGHAFTAHADLADHEAGVSKCTIIHNIPLIVHSSL